MATLLHPGSGLHLPIPAGSGGTAGVQTSLSLKDFMAHVFPTSIADAMAKNEILQIVIFSVFAGAAIAALGERAAGLLGLVEQLAQVMLKMTNYVMMLAPVAVFAALAAPVTAQGLGILATYAAFVGSLLRRAFDPVGAVVPSGISRGGKPDRRPVPRHSPAGASRLLHLDLRSRLSHARWRSLSCSGCQSASPASSCRSGIRSTSTAR